MNNDILNKIEASMGGFSKGQRLIANYILLHFDKAAYMTATRLGDEVGVSESTVVRFAIELELSGYPELQQHIQEAVRKRLTAVQRISVANDRLSKTDVAGSVLLSDIEKLRYTMEHLDRSAFDYAIDAILSAKKIYIIGMRASAPLAQFMHHYFRLITDNVILIQTTSGSEIFEQMINITPEDVIIAISFPRYSARIVNATDFAAQAGAKVIALTDNDDSPIARHAYATLTARSDMASFVDSLVAPLSIINSIIAAVGMKKQDEVSVTLTRLEAVWELYNVYNPVDDDNEKQVEEM